LLKWGTVAEESLCPVPFPVVILSNCHTTTCLFLLTVVSIAEPDNITPLPPAEENTRNGRFSTGLASRRMTGRPGIPSNSSSRISLVSQNSLDDFNLSDTTGTQQPRGEGHPYHHHAHRHDKLLLQVSEWLQREKAKRAARKSSKRGSKDSESDKAKQGADASRPSRSRATSQCSDSSAFSLETLQRIVEENIGGYSSDKLPIASPSLGPRRPSQANRRRSSVRRLNVQS
jgi:choline kinase